MEVNLVAVRQEAINEQKDAEKELVNEFSQGLDDMLIDSVNTTDSIADVFTRMINQILEEKNITDLHFTFKVFVIYPSLYMASIVYCCLINRP